MNSLAGRRARAARWLAVASLLAVGLFLAWWFRESLLIGAGQWLDVGGEPRPAKYVLILAGDETTRPFAGGALLLSGYAESALLISAVAGPEELDGDRPATGEVAGRVLAAMGVAPQRMRILEGRSDSTFGDANLLKRFLDDHPDGDVTAVTSHFHTRRSRWVFRLVLGDQIRRVRFVSCPTDGYDLNNWHHSKRGFAAVGSEYMKFLIYWVRYGKGAWWLAAAAVVAIALRWRRSRQLRPTHEAS